MCVYTLVKLFIFQFPCLLSAFGLFLQRKMHCSDATGLYVCRLCFSQHLHLRYGGPWLFWQADKTSLAQSKALMACLTGAVLQCAADKLCWEYACYLVFGKWHLSGLEHYRDSASGFSPAEQKLIIIFMIIFFVCFLWKILNGFAVLSTASYFYEINWDPWKYLRPKNNLWN